jgi:putative transcriptional regulator
VAESLRGQLLIASPSLVDYFRRTVVLVVEHTDEGALGVVLNRPSESSIAEVVPPLACFVEEDDVVYVGGPVAPETALVLGDFEEPTDAATPVVGGVGVVDPDRPGTALRRLRVYAGHAGWAAGQLDGEIEQGAWIVEPADPEDPFVGGDLWALTLQRKGGRYALLATMPEDPSLN